MHTSPFSPLTPLSTCQILLLDSQFGEKGLGVFCWGNLSQQLPLLLTGSLVDFLKTPPGIKLTINKLLDMAAQVRRLGRGWAGAQPNGVRMPGPGLLTSYPVCRLQRAWHSLKSGIISTVT